MDSEPARATHPGAVVSGEAPRTRSVALLRGVGGPTALRMPELRSALADSGITDVVTLQVAGNIIFDPGGRTPDACATLIRRTVRMRLGHDLPVLIRSHEQLLEAQRRNPYVGSHEGRWVMTVFLDQVSHASNDLDPAAGAPDVFTVDGPEVFVRHASGVAGSKLQAAWFEKRLGVIGTARNANTVGKLIQLTAMQHDESQVRERA